MVIQVVTNRAFWNDGNVLECYVCTAQYGKHQLYVATENLKHDWCE